MDAALCRALKVPRLHEHVSAFLRAPPSAAEEVLRLCLVTDEKGPYSVALSHPRVQALCALRVCLLCALGGGPVTQEDLCRDGAFFASEAGGVVCRTVLGQEGRHEETLFEAGEGGTVVLCRLLSFLLWGPGGEEEGEGLTWRGCTWEWAEENAPEVLDEWTDQEWRGGEAEWRAAAEALAGGGDMARDLAMHVFLLGLRECRPVRTPQWEFAYGQPALDVALVQLQVLMRDHLLLDGTAQLVFLIGVRPLVAAHRVVRHRSFAGDG